MNADSTKRRPRGPLRPATVLVGAAGVLAAVVLGGLLTAGNSARHDPLPQARPFTLTRLGQPGKQLALASYTGEPVVVNFFASWCGPCKKETPLLAEFYRSHHGRILVVGVDANDQSSKALAFLRTRGVSYPVAFDPSAAVTVSYGVMALPQTFFLNAKHQIVSHIVGGLTAAELNSWAASLTHRNGTS